MQNLGVNFGIYSSVFIEDVDMQLHNALSEVLLVHDAKQTRNRYILQQCTFEGCGNIALYQDRKVDCHNLPVACIHLNVRICNQVNVENLNSFLPGIFMIVRSFHDLYPLSYLITAGPRMWALGRDVRRATVEEHI